MCDPIIVTKGLFLLSATVSVSQLKLGHENPDAPARC